MNNQIYTATGCARCKITKKYLQENKIDYDEFDFKAEGKEAFAQFYRSNRNAIFRDQDGVEFPVFYDGKAIRQGVSVILGYLKTGDGLAGFIGRSVLHGEWIDGFNISGGEPSQIDSLVEVLSYLKSNGLKVQASTNGLNASLLETLTQKSLLDRVIMEINAPPALYQKVTGKTITEEELKKSIQLTSTLPEYQFNTTISPFEHEGGEISYLTPEETGEIAKLIEEATGSKKHPFKIYPFDPQKAESEIPSAIDPLPSSALFKYRTAARRYQVMTEIEK